MVSPENTNWLMEYGLIDDDPNFSLPVTAFSWPVQNFHASSNAGVEVDGSLGDSDTPKDAYSKKRGRSESCSGSSLKACREKQRRERLNDK